jgi:hypothetical protein
MAQVVDGLPRKCKALSSNPKSSKSQCCKTLQRWSRMRTESVSFTFHFLKWEEEKMGWAMRTKLRSDGVRHSDVLLHGKVTVDSSNVLYTSER